MGSQTPVLVSVIIPTYNRLELLKESLKSVLEQTYPNLEILVVDNGSTDDTIDYLKGLNEPRLKILVEMRRGAAFTRNLGITKSSGDILTFLDSDDLWMPDKVSLQLERLVQSKSEVLIFSGYREFNRFDRETLLKPRFPKMNLSVITMMARKSEFLSVGLFEESLNFGEFMDWYSRALSKGFKHETLDDVLALRRVHAGNTAENSRSATGYLRACKNLIDLKQRRSKTT